MVENKNRKDGGRQRFLEAVAGIARDNWEKIKDQPCRTRTEAVDMALDRASEMGLPFIPTREEYQGITREIA